MKKFKFPLENVLKVRTLHKKMAERETAATQNQLLHTERQIDECRQAYERSFHPLPGQGRNMAFWHEVAANYQQGLRARAEQLAGQKAKLEERLAVQKKALRRKLRDERALENLKDRQRREHETQAALEEQREIEELDLLKRGRNS